MMFDDSRTGWKPTGRPPRAWTSRRSGEGGGTLPLAVRVGERLDLDQLWRIRTLAWPRRGTVPALTLDFQHTHALDADAALLLAEDLRALVGSGTRVRLRGLGGRLRRSLRFHPLLAFCTDDDALFTDPDLDATGFRPSRH